MRPTSKAIFIALVTALLSLASGSAQAQMTIERGREVHEWFLTGQLDRIWALRSPDTASGSSMFTYDRLENRHRDFCRRYGVRLSVVREELRPYQGSYHYNRVERFEHYDDNLHFHWGFDAQGRVTGLSYPQYITTPMRPPRSAEDDMGDGLFLIAIALGAVFFVSLFLIATIVFVFRRQRRWGRKWALAAAQLQMELEPFRPEMHSSLHKLGGKDASKHVTLAQRMLGLRQGIAVAIGVRAEGRGYGDERHVVYITYVEASIEPSLLAGLKVKPTGLGHRVLASVGLAQDIQLNDKQLDDAFTISALDEEYARRILTSPPIREVLLRNLSKRWRLVIVDNAVRFEREALVFRAAELEMLLQRALTIAAPLREARMQLPPPMVEGVLRDVWTPVALRRGLAIHVQKAEAKGLVGSSELRITVEHRAGRFWTVFQLHFGQPLGVGLSLTPEGALSGVGKALGMQDIQTGDPDFDRRFVVKGEKIEETRHLLTPEARRLLATLHDQTTELAVNDEELRVQLNWFVQDAQHLEGGLDLLWETGLALTHASRENPYRA